MTQPFLGQIQPYAFGFAPRNWALCNGQLLSIAQNTALFALLGTMYGGNGQTTFALPNLQSSVPIHKGQALGGSIYDQGESGGAEDVTLGTAQIPSHTHTLPTVGASKDEFTSESPAGAYPTVGGIYGTPSAVDLASTPSSSTTSLPHNNVQPYLTISFCIAMAGIFPSRN